MQSNAAACSSCRQRAARLFNNWCRTYLRHHPALLPPLQDTVLPGPLQTRASVRLSASCATLLGGPAAPPPVDFASLAEASQGLPTVAAEACRLAADGYCSAMRLQVGGALLLLPGFFSMWGGGEGARCERWWGHVLQGELRLWPSPQPASRAYAAVNVRR
jgi:hypothetical protein